MFMTYTLTSGDINLCHMRPYNPPNKTIFKNILYSIHCFPSQTINKDKHRYKVENSRVLALVITATLFTFLLIFFLNYVMKNANLDFVPSGGSNTNHLIGWSEPKSERLLMAVQFVFRVLFVENYRNLVSSNVMMNNHYYSTNVKRT